MSARPVNCRWRWWVAVSALALGTPNLPAQSRYQNAGYEFNWFLAHLRQISLGIEVEAESEDARLNNSNSDYHRDHVYVAPTVGLDLEGSVYHPNLLYFDVKTETGVSWQEQTLNQPTGLSSAGTETKTQWLGRYDAELAFLKEQPYATLLTAAKDHNFRQYDFFNRATLDTERYGARSGYAAGPIPFSVTVRNWTEDVSSSTRPSHLEETTLSLDARNDRPRNCTTTLFYEYDDYRRTEPGLPPDDYTYHRVNLLDRENFGRREQASLNSTLFYQKQDGNTVDGESLTWQENLAAKHTERLQSDYHYAFDDRSRDSSDSQTHSWQAALHHRLYDNLNSSVDVHGDKQDSSSSGSSLNTTRYGVGWREGYTRHLGSWGRLSIGTNLRYDKEQRETSGQSVAIIQEPHTLTDGVITYLNQPRVILSTVRVTDASGRAYQLLLDYVLIPHGELTEIRRASGNSQIPNGSAILVDYQALLPPSDDFETLSGQFSVRLDLFKEMLGLYARLSTLDNWGAEDMALQDLFDQIYGVDFSWRWLRTGAEYEIYDSNLGPYNAARLFQTLTFALNESSSLSFNFAETWYTFPDTDIERETADAITRLRTQLTSHLLWETEGGVRLDRGPGFDQTLYVARTGLEYSRGQLAFKLGYDFQNQDYLGETRERHFFFLRARRTF